MSISSKLACEYRTPDVIIFGGMRCGTTSLFRYISSHPKVFKSRKKELDVFTLYDDRGDDVLLSKYQDVFGKEDENRNKLCIEASPSYTRRYKETSNRISNLLGEVKIIFIIRKPEDRFKSVFGSIKRSGKIKNNINYFEFVDAMFEKDTSIFEEGRIPKDIFNEVELGKYSKIINTLIEDFGRDNVLVVSTEDISSNAIAVMEEVCSFIGVNSDYYEGYTFQVENPTVEARFNFIYRMALLVNQKMERYLNKVPRFRNFLRALHGRINVQKANNNKKDKEYSRLNEYYKEDRLNLKELLYMNKYTIPEWLKHSDEDY